MKIIVAKNAGFCFGVRRVLKRCMIILIRQKAIYLRPIIHNPEVVEELKDKEL